MLSMPTEAEPTRVVEGEALDMLRAVPSASIDAVVTDPPYPEIDREYGRWTEAEWFALMDPLVAECRRVLKPTGSAVFILQANSERVGRMRPWLWEFMAKWTREWGMVQDAYWWNPATPPTIHCQRARGGMRPSVKPCVWLGTEDCYRNQDGVLWAESDAMAAEDRADRALRRFPGGQSIRRGRIGAVVDARGGVTPFNLLPIPNSNSTDSAGSHGHGAGTPMKLARWWVRYICPPEGIVLDPFLGSGTTAVAALLENRRCIGSERFPQYAEIARGRIREAMGTGLLAMIDG